VNQKAALALGALAGAAAAVLLGRRRPRVLTRAAPPADPRADELRRKLDEARQADVDENEFNAAGMGAETIVAEEPSRREPPPATEFEAMRQRVHEEARAAAEEMRRRAETDT
jgi:gamma-glutamyl:cysteine ligase YbdK (ATP-grasp superfamily)